MPTFLGHDLSEGQSRVLWVTLGAAAGTLVAAAVFNRTLRNTYEQCVPLQVSLSAGVVHRCMFCSSDL